MRLLKYITCLLAATVAFPLGLFAAAYPTHVSASCNCTQPNLEATRLLKEVGDHAYQIEFATDRADDLSRSTGTDWQVLAERLTTVRENVNDIGKELARLQTLHAAMPAGEQQEIHQITPVLQEIANHTQDAIQLLNHNEQGFWITNVPTDFQSIYSEAMQVDGSVSALERNMKVNKYQTS